MLTKQTKTDLVSNLSFNVDEIEKDFLAIIKKHYTGQPLSSVSVMSDTGFGNEKGFYLIMIKREDKKDRKIRVASFGSDIRIEEIVDAVSGLLSEMMNGQDMGSMGQA